MQADGHRDRSALGGFLRHRREQLAPGDVGLVAGPRRRAVGLRRDEVSLLAAISTDYYERIEQGRGPHPSAEVLGAICRALRLTLDERDHVHHLAGAPPPARHRSAGWADAGLMCVLDALAPTVPALITDDLCTVVAQNPLNVALLGPLTGQAGRRSNFLWRWFTDPDLRGRYAIEQHETLSREYVADLRATSGARSGDADVRELVDDLTGSSEEFARLWALQEVAVRRSTRKVVIHPDVGRLELECDVVVSPPRPSAWCSSAPSRAPAPPSAWTCCAWSAPRTWPPHQPGAEGAGTPDAGHGCRARPPRSSSAPALGVAAQRARIGFDGAACGSRHDLRCVRRRCATSRVATRTRP